MKPDAPLETIPGLIRNVVAEIHPPDHPFLIHKKKGTWVEISYQEALEKIDAISAYLLSIGIRKGDRLALLTENGPEYVYFDQALQQIGCVNVSLYPTLPEQDTEYILKDSSAKVILVGSTFLLKKILKISNNCPSLTRIIPLFTNFQSLLTPQLKAGVLSLQDLILEGKNQLETQEKNIEQLRNAILPSDLSTLIYTSGTTGIPKGVMLSHYNLVNNVKISLQQIPHITKDDLFLSFLPLSHVFERTATYHICLTAGCRIAFAESLELLARNMKELKPTVVNCVPRLLERIYEKAMKAGTAGGGLKPKLFNWALETGQRYREQTEAGISPGIASSVKKAVAEKLVFNKIKSKTGGKLKFMISGGGALPKNIGEFFGSLGIKILEGYGLTETSPVVAVTEFDRQIYGTVGRVLPEVEIAIKEIESSHLYTIQTHESFQPNFESPEGEILIRGSCVMKGYWNKPEETAQVIDAEGWFHSGDIGRFYKGNLQITDRIKNMLVNSFGKNIYPTPVENTYLKSPKIDQIFLLGDRREYIAAIIVPSKELLKETFSLPESFFNLEDDLIENPEIINWVLKDVQTLSSSLAKFERVRNIVLKRHPFSIEKGELTPTLKAKRRVIEKKYANLIDQLYQ